MINMKKTIIWLFIFLIILFPFTAAAESFGSIVASSDNLKTLSCFVTAESTMNHRKSRIEYTFAFKRDGLKMRIEYAAPKNMKGTIIALDGKYFYDYIPGLNMKMKKKINPKSTRNPGKDMGIFFYYVKGNLADDVSGIKIIFRGKENIDIEGRKSRETLEADHYTFTRGRERQEVWFNSGSGIPVMVEIYAGNKLKLKMMVSDIKLNEPIDDSIFSLQ